MVVVVWGLPIALLLLLFSQRWKCRIIRFGRRRRRIVPRDTSLEAAVSAFGLPPIFFSFRFWI